MPWEFKTLTSQCVQHLSWMNSVTSSALCCQCCFLTDSTNIWKYFKEIGYAWLCYVTAGIVPNIHCTPLKKNKEAAKGSILFCSLFQFVLYALCGFWSFANVYGCGYVAMPKLHKVVLGSALDPVKVEFSRPHRPTQDFWGPILRFDSTSNSSTCQIPFKSVSLHRPSVERLLSGELKNIQEHSKTMCSAFQEMRDYCPNQSSRFLNDATSEDPAGLPFAPCKESKRARRSFQCRAREMRPKQRKRPKRELRSCSS